MSELEVTNFLQTSQNILSEPDSIEPLELAGYFHTFLRYGVHDHITSLVQRYFYANLNHPQLIRFIRLIDQLIRLSYPLPNNFPDMFIQCFYSCFKRGQKTLIDELTILRKMWTPFIQPPTLAYMRQQIFSCTEIDLDGELREETKNFLKKYFDKNFKLSHQELFEILEAKLPFRRALNPKTQCIFNLQPEQSKREWTHGRKKVKIDNEDIYTKASFHTEPSPQTSREPTKIQKINGILKKLKQITDFQCQECGKRFSMSESLKKHREEHFAQKLRDYTFRTMNEGLRKLKLSKKDRELEKSPEKFIGNSVNTFLTFDSPCIAVKQNKRQSGDRIIMGKSCHFCGREFTVAFKDQLMYQRAIKVKFLQDGCDAEKEEIHLMHADCYIALSEN